jgi:membrane protein DedA with SNARE-associated domain
LAAWPTFGRAAYPSGRLAVRRAAAPLLLALLVHFHRFHGSPLDYATLAAAAFASWVGLPGPGEPLLIAAGVLAAKHKLDLTETLVVAFGAATAGGVLGWLLGLKAGRALIVRPGPFLRGRRRALQRGEEVFERYPRTAVLLTTSWIAGILGVDTGVYMVWNAVGAAVWTLVIGLGGFFAGPPIVEVVSDVGLIPVIGLVLLVIAAVSFEIGRRRRRAGGATATSPPS